MGKYLALTLDPLHIGAGGYRLGRVDNTIVRDAGTGLPKIPGSSLAGVIRCYSGWCLKDDQVENVDKAVESIFGFAADGKDQKNSRIGLVHFYDGTILAFPVSTLIGPVWVSCPSILAMHGITLKEIPDQETLHIYSGQTKPTNITHLNMGWLYLPCKIMDKGIGEGGLGLNLYAAKPVITQFVVAPDWIFAEIVNSNLEVRTSVKIDSETGAAETGALFTYEAIPSSTLISFDIEIDTHRCDENNTEKKITDLLKRSFKMCSALGIGGMSTRGFGRMRFLEED